MPTSRPFARLWLFEYNTQGYDRKSPCTSVGTIDGTMLTGQGQHTVSEAQPVVDVS